MAVQGRRAEGFAVLRATASGGAAAALSAASGVQALRFCVVGLLGTVINLAVYGALVANAGVAPALAAIGGFTIAVTHNHLLNRVWTFGDRSTRYLPQGARFLGISLAALAVNLAVLRGLLTAGVGHLPAQALGIGAATPVGFLANRAWTFKGRA
jgi:putative flippase GtrA